MLKSKVSLVGSENLNDLDWLRSDEAATYLRMSRDALRTAAYRGEVRSYKWRRRLYFKKSELDHMIRSSLRR
jgi:excisionase family DNA binding protein